jgi:class 3 adenylate cyclase
VSKLGIKIARKRTRKQQKMKFWNEQIVKNCVINGKKFAVEEENEYNNWHYDTNFRYLQIAIVGSTILTFAIMLFSYLVLDHSQENVAQKWPQITLLGILVSTIASLKTKFFRSHHQECIGVLMTIFSLVATHTILNLPESRVQIGYGIFFSILLVCYGLMRLKAVYASTSCVLGSVWFVYAATKTPYFSTAEILQISGYLVNFNLTGMILAYTMDKIHRQNFMALKNVSREYERAESLLLSILPIDIANRLKLDKASIADHLPEVTVLFADIVDFSSLAKTLPPQEVVQILNALFIEFDAVMEKHGVEKIKTIGDAYMAAAGLKSGQANHAERVANAALDLLTATNAASIKLGYRLKVRIGLNSGAVIAGVIGQKKMIYDLWGDTVNIASRMESGGTPSQIQVSENTWTILRNKFNFGQAQVQQVKGHGNMHIYMLLGPLNTAEVGSTESMDPQLSAQNFHKAS